MSNPGFQFKQFYVRHDQCAMKVGTDGVLLGAWAGENTTYPRILDIGTGSGLIALMLAQRFERAQIIGIDIDIEASQQAHENFQASPWHTRLQVQHTALQDFSVNEEGLFDLIVSNPPFFQNSLKNPNYQRSTARHTDTLPHSVLLASVARLLKEDGRFCVILPTELTDSLLQTALQYGLHEQRRLEVYPTPQRPCKRILLDFGKKKSVFPLQEKLIIEMEGRHNYSPEYRQLTSSFYLHQ